MVCTPKEPDENVLYVADKGEDGQSLGVLWAVMHIYLHCFPLSQGTCEGSMSDLHHSLTLARCVEVGGAQYMCSLFFGCRSENQAHVKIRPISTLASPLHSYPMTNVNLDSGNNA